MAVLASSKRRRNWYTLMALALLMLLALAAMVEYVDAGRDFYSILVSALCCVCFASVRCALACSLRASAA